MWLLKVKFNKDYLHSEKWVFRKGQSIERMLTDKQQKNYIKHDLFSKEYLKNMPYNHISCKKIPKEVHKNMKNGNFSTIFTVPKIKVVK